jgi:hypothetical protein
MAVDPLPRKARALISNEAVTIRKLLLAYASEFSKIVSKVKTPRGMDLVMSNLYSVSSSMVDDLGKELFENIKAIRALSINEETVFLSGTRLPAIASEEWREYLNNGQRILNLSMSQYLNAKSIIDGTSMKYRLKTIKDGTDKVVEAIIKNGMAEGKSAWQIGKEIEKYIAIDRRTKWTSPYRILRREKGFPITAPYDGGVRAGSVDYNALRIARTEMINNYRWSKIDATKGRDFVVGWKWSLSNAHPKPDECDTWATHDEGLGEGVYSDAKDISSLGHPNCLCNVTTQTVFHDDMAQFFEKAYNDLDKPIKKYVDF